MFSVRLSDFTSTGKNAPTHVSKGKRDANVNITELVETLKRIEAKLDKLLENK
jgi:hypothetical protein